MDMNFSYNNEFLNSSNEDDFDENSVIPPMIRFWILLIFSIPSIICSIVILYLLLNHKEHRRSLNHRVVIIQLIGGLIYLLTHVPIYLNYLRLGYVWPQTPTMCHIWWFVGDEEKRIFAHYLPITIIIIYCPLYYLIVMGFPPCENIYDYTKKLCSSSCLYRNDILLLYDAIFNDILATILIAIFSISLIIRVLWHNQIRYRQRLQWRKHQKIIIILMSISMIYLTFNLPVMILDLADICGLSQHITEKFEPYFDFLNYFIFIFYPFICLGTMLSKIRNPRRQRLVGIVGMTAIPRTKSQNRQTQQLR
ncbi:unnamed protein product [Rotaria sp. Silwood1]|nr:unnamed protein product [Rotaria sp. Silwood1]